MLLGLCNYVEITNRILPSSGSKKNLPRIFTRAEKACFTEHLYMLGEFVRSGALAGELVISSLLLLT